VLVWALCIGLAAKTIVTDTRVSPIYVTRPDPTTGYPRLADFRSPGAARGTSLAVGDTLLRIGDVDLRGVSPLGFWVRVPVAARGQRTVSVEYARDHARHETSLALDSARIVWPLLPVSVVFGLTAVFLLLRAAPSPAIRVDFWALMSTAIIFVSYFAG